MSARHVPSVPGTVRFIIDVPVPVDPDVFIRAMQMLGVVTADDPEGD